MQRTGLDKVWRHQTGDGEQLSTCRIRPEMIVSMLSLMSVGDPRAPKNFQMSKAISGHHASGVAGLTAPSMGIERDRIGC